MTKFCTNRNKQTILIESIPYSNWEIEMVRMNIPADNRSFRQELLSFLSEWFDPADTLPVHTSGEFYQFNLSSCIRQQNSLTAQFVSFSLSNLANIFYPPPIFTIINLCLL